MTVQRRSIPLRRRRCEPLLALKAFQRRGREKNHSCSQHRNLINKMFENRNMAENRRNFEMKKFADKQLDSQMKIP